MINEKRKMSIAEFVDKLAREQRAKKSLSKLFGRGPTADEVKEERVGETNPVPES